ncbi:rnf213a [Symbiodinium sp. CCMP2456]|nr:rnf213a [Symbiodinium sp. CCMP2456]
MARATVSRRSDEDSDGADTSHLCEWENLLRPVEYARDDDLWPAYMRCIAVSLVQFACAPLVFLCAYSGRGSAAAMTVGFMLLGSMVFQYWLVGTLVSWLKRQPCRATWQHSIDALADFGSTCSICGFLSGAFALFLGMIEAIDPALDAWAAANAFNLYTDDLCVKFESSWNYIPLLGWLVAWLGLPGVLLSILLFSMLCQLWFLFRKDQYVTAERLFDKFRQGAETCAECRYKLWYQWKHVTDLGGLLVLLGVFEKLVHAELDLDTDGDLYPVVDRFWSFIPKVCGSVPVMFIRLMADASTLNIKIAKLRESLRNVMFGSTFPNDLSDMFVAMNLQRIKSFMQQPISLVMVHCDSLYESLYDLLNQHYMEYAGQRYVRIAHGSKAKQCPIHHLFRVIVITEISDAYFRLAPPLLNRFEKQIFLRKDLMSKSDEALLARVTKFWVTLNEPLGYS